MPLTVKEIRRDNNYVGVGVSPVKIKNVARANPRDCSRENVEKALLEKDFTSLCFVNHGMYILNEENFTSDDGWGDIFASSNRGICQVCAPPVLMALYLGRYDLVKGLVESGEQLTAEMTNDILQIKNVNPIIGYIITAAEEGMQFTIGHYIMGDPNMPDELRLYLWTMTAGRMHKQIGDYRKEKGYSEIYTKIPLPVEFGYFTFDSADDVGLKLFRKQEYIDTFLHSLKVMGERRRRYFEDIPNANWRDIIGNGDNRISIPATIILLEQGLYGEENLKKRIISEYLTYRIEGFGPLHSWELDMYEEIHKHYESEDLEYIYYALLINRYVHLQELKKQGIILTRGKKRSKENNLLEDRLWSMIKKIYPVDQPLNHLLSLPTADKDCAGTTFLSKVRDAGILMEMYKKLTQKPVIIDESCSNLMIRDEDYLSDEDGHYLTKFIWLEKVDSFSYDESEPLGKLQLLFIYHKSLDIFALATRKGLLKGRHSDKAIEYCLENEGLLNKIPCIVAYANK